MLNKHEGKPGEELKKNSHSEVFLKTRKAELWTQLAHNSFLKKVTASPKITPSESFFEDFALHVLRYLNIFRTFICQYSVDIVILGLNYKEVKMIDAL